MRQYHNLLRAIRNFGTHKPAARENMPGTTSRFGYQMTLDLQRGFPILTTKKIKFDLIATELLWFLRGDSNIKYLIDNDCNIWNEDAYNYYVEIAKKHKRFVLPFDIFIADIKNDIGLEWDDYVLGDTGFQYPKVWRNWGGVYREVDQVLNLINGLINNPQGRRHMITSMDPAHDQDLALYWCHGPVQFNCRLMADDEVWDYVDPDDKTSVSRAPKYHLDCHFYQRSADVFLGVPFNTMSYALLTHLLAEICNMVPGELIHTFGDVHIYDNHQDAVDTILERDWDLYPQPKLYLNDTIKQKVNEMVQSISSDSIDKLIRSLDPSDFSLPDYQSYPAIKAKLSTGLK